jgi:hypothetical protein
MGITDFIKDVAKVVVPVAAGVEIAKGIASGEGVGEAISKSSVGRFAKGFAGGVGDAAKGVVELGKAVIKNPAETGAGLVKAALNPIETGKAIVSSYKETYRDEYRKNGAAGAVGRGTAEALLVVLGTKGVDKVAKAAVATKAGSKVASATANAGRKATDVVRQASDRATGALRPGGTGGAAGAAEGVLDLGRLSKLPVLDGPKRSAAIARMRQGDPLFGDPEVQAKFAGYLNARGITGVEDAYKAGLEFARATDRTVRRSRHAEPRITRDVTNAAGEAGATLTKLETRTKSVDSLRRKAAQDGIKEADLSPTALAAGISDPVRYTALFAPDKYVAGMNALVDRLRREGYELVVDGGGNPKLKNLWTPEAGGTKVPMVNIQLVKPGTGQRFEIRAHTPDSFRADELTHGIYEEMRLLEPGSRKFRELDEQRAAINAAVVDPPGIGDFGARASSLGDYTGTAA